MNFTDLKPETQQAFQDDEFDEWMAENWQGILSPQHPQYDFERQMFMLIYYDAMQMSLDLSGRYPSEACDISSIAAHSAWSYSWLL